MKHIRSRRAEGVFDYVMAILVLSALILFVTVIALHLHSSRKSAVIKDKARGQSAQVTRSFCGDKLCGEGEDCSNCPEDCGLCSGECGNCKCERGENCTNCPVDCCGCGDGVCNRLCGESVLNCPDDCDH